MTEKRFTYGLRKGTTMYEIKDSYHEFPIVEPYYYESSAKKVCDLLNELNDENEHLKTTISRLIEQNRKNNDLLVSDIRLLEKALWCPNCTRNIKRLKELKKEFEND